MKRIAILFLLVSLVGCTNEKPKRGTITHGGDDLRPLFKDAKKIAIGKMKKLRPEKVAEFGTERARNFFFGHQDALIEDVEQSPHEWIDEAQATCGKTGGERNALITFSFPSCRLDAHEPARRLIHESVHHFAIDSESFADEVADLVTKFPDVDLEGSWRAIAPLSPPEPFVTLDKPTIALAYATTDGYVMLRWQAQLDYLRAGLFDVNTHQWKKVANPPGGWSLPSVSFGGVALGDKIYFWGGSFGYPGSEILNANDVFIYSPHDQTWDRKDSPHAPEAWSQPQLYPYGKKIFVYGGFYSNITENVLHNFLRAAVYDPQTNDWKTFQSEIPSTGNTNLLPFWTGTRLLLLGQSGRTYSALSFDPATRTWQRIDSRPKAALVSRESWSAAVWTGESFLFFDSVVRLSSEEPYAGWQWDVAKDRWSYISAEGAPSPREYASQVWTGSALAVYGGHSYAGEGWLQDGALYDPRLNRWRPIQSSSLTKNRANATSVWTGKQWFLWGGTNPLKDWRLDGEVYTP